MGHGGGVDTEVWLTMFVNYATIDGYIYKVSIE